MRWKTLLIAAIIAAEGVTAYTQWERVRPVGRAVYVWLWEHFDITGEPVPDRFLPAR